MGIATPLGLALGSLAALLSMQACGSSSGGNPAQTGEAGAGSSSGSGSGGSSGGSGSSSGASPSTPYVGSIAVDMGSTMGPTGQPFHSLSATFYATPDGGASATGCSGTQSGSCCYTPGPPDGGVAVPGPTYVSAGTITVKDGSSTIATIMPDTSNTYSAANATWMGGDTLSFTATGATIDAFSATVQVPAFPAGLQPIFTTAGTLMIPQSSDFTVTWTDRISGAVDDLFIAQPGGDAIRCNDVPDTAGSITVPSALLANLNKGATLAISLYRFVITTTNAANVTVTTGAGAELIGHGTLQ